MTKAEEARARYVPGVGAVALAKDLGISITTLYRWVNPEYEERLRHLSREAKRRRRGTCQDCGAETRYAGHGKAVSDLCHPCAARRSASKRQGVGPIVTPMLGLLAANGPMHFKELRDALEINSNLAYVTIDRLRRYGLIVRVSRGVYALPKSEHPLDGGAAEE